MLPSLEDLAHTFGPFAAFVVATFDRSGLPLLVGSVCVAVGAAGGHLAPTVAFATAGMIAGDLALYEIGRRGGPKTKLASALLRPLLPLRATARAILKKHPFWSLAFGRYVAGAGILLPFVAGLSGLPRRRTWMILIFGSAAYVVPWGAAAFLLGKRFVSSMEDLGGGIAWLGGAGVLCVVAWFVYMRVKRRARKAQAHQSREKADASRP